MWDEQNTGTNLPAQIELYATDGDAYSFLFMAKGGGSANKSYLFQETKALLNPERLMAFLDEKTRMLGTAACPPYHLAIVIGGTSAEYALKTAKYASARYLDSLPTSGNDLGRGFRDLELEAQVLEMTRTTGIGAQFGGKYFCHDVRVDPPPPPRRLVPGRDRGQLLGRPPGQGEDHRRRRLPRGARAQPGPLPARRHRRGAARRERRRGRAHRPRTGRWPRSAPSSRSTRSAPASSLTGRWSWPATSPTPRSRTASTPASRCRTTCATTASTTPARPRRPTATRRARSARRPPAAWTRTSTSSRPPAAAS